MKMRAILRYRRLPYVWHQMGVGDDKVFQYVKAPVIPVIRYPDGSWHNDSTPMLFDPRSANAKQDVLRSDGLRNEDRLHETKSIQSR